MRNPRLGVPIGVADPFGEGSGRFLTEPQLGGELGARLGGAGPNLSGPRLGVEASTT